MAITTTSQDATRSHAESPCGKPMQQPGARKLPRLPDLSCTPRTSNKSVCVTAMATAAPTAQMSDAALARTTAAVKSTAEPMGAAGGALVGAPVGFSVGSGLGSRVGDEDGSAVGCQRRGLQ